jgi:hypothetical protein
MSKTRAAAGGALLAIVIALGGAQAAFADATPHPNPAGAPTATTTAESMEGMEGMDQNMPMAGMNHGAAPASTTASEMPPTSDAQTASTHSHNGMPVASTAPPRTLALGGFAALNGAVLARAGVLRRRGKRGRAMRISQQHSAR